MVVPSQLVLTVKLNHIYIWAGAHAESLIEARLNEDPELRINTPTALLDQLAPCLTHSTYFREQREEFYSIHQKGGENNTTYFSRIMEIHRHAEFLDNSHFLILDKFIHGCKSRECKRKLMAKGKDVTIKNCLEIMRKFEAVEVTMKKLEDVGDASYARDPIKKSQRNGYKKEQEKPKLHQKQPKA